LEQLLVELLAQPRRQLFARLHRLQLAEHVGVAAATRGPPRRQEVGPGVVGQGAQPAAEAARAVVVEAAQGLDEAEQGGLGDVLAILLAEVPAAAPGVDARAVAADERLPGLLVRRRGPQPAQQRRARLRR